MAAPAGLHDATHPGQVIRDLAPRAVGVVTVGVVALAVPILVGLTVSAVVYGLTAPGGRLPLAQLAAVTLGDLVLLGLVGSAGYRAWCRRHPT